MKLDIDQIAPKSLPDVPGLSDAILAAEIEYVAAVEEWRCKRRILLGMRDSACESPETVAADELIARREVITDAELETAQDALSHNRLYVQCQKRRITYLTMNYGERTAELEKTEVAIATRLYASDIKAESIQPSPNAAEPTSKLHSDAGRNLFAERVRDSAEWQAANALVEGAAGTLQLANDALHRGCERVAVSEVAVKAIVSRIIGIPTLTVGAEIHAAQSIPLHQ